jgi:hypothetical protein
MDSFDNVADWSLPGRLAAWSLPSAAWSLPSAAWSQPKNFVARPSVKALIEHSCPNWTQEPASLDPSILAAHQRGEKEIAETKGQMDKVLAEVSKVEKQLVEAEDSLKKNKWSKVDDKKALIERLKRELLEAKGKQVTVSERMDTLEKRYGPIKTLMEDQEKLVEIYKRIMKTRDEYYGLSVSA